MSFFSNLKLSRFLKVMSVAFSSTIIVQILSVFRQVLITSSMGFSRDLDIFYTGFSIATIMALSFNPVYENIMASFGGASDTKRVSDHYLNVLLASLIISLFGILVTIVFFPILSSIFAAGFSNKEKIVLSNELVGFIPWVILSAIFSVTQSLMRVQGKYKRTFLFDVSIVGISLIFLLLIKKQMTISGIIHSYSIAYLAALSAAIPLTLKDLESYKIELKEVVSLTTGILKRFFANQTSVFYSLVERYFFSFLPSGGISILSVVTQISINISSLLSFRDIYVYPLIGARDRSAIFKRISDGLLFVNSVVLCFLIFNSELAVNLLFNWGKVQKSDIEVVSRVLSIVSLSLLISILSTMTMKLLVIEGRNRRVIQYYLTVGFTYALFAGIVFFVSKITVISLSWTLLAVNFIGAAFLISCLSDVGINFRIRPYLGLFLTMVGYQTVLSYLVHFIDLHAGDLMILLVRGTVYSLFTLPVLFILRKRLKSVLTIAES